MVQDANSQKTPLAQSLNVFAAGKAADALQKLGKGLPCKVKTVISPWIVTVNFALDATPWSLQPVTIPVAAPPYIAYPIQVGDAGEVISSDLRLGQITGLGAGTPKLTDTPANLSNLAFLWLGNTAWTTLDPEAVVIWENIVASQTQLAFYGGAKVDQPTIDGDLSSVTDPAAKAVLTSIIAALKASSGVNLAIDGTT
jgi:hypothetical protein